MQVTYQKSLVLQKKMIIPIFSYVKDAKRLLLQKEKIWEDRRKYKFNEKVSHAVVWFSRCTHTMLLLCRILGPTHEISVLITYAQNQGLQIRVHT